jgi:hypothetical protein
MDLNNMQAWQYFAFAGGGVFVLGLIIYFLPAGKLKVPAVVTGGFGGLAAGLALGVLFMAGFGYKPHPVDPPSSDPPPDGSPPPGMMPKGGAPKGGPGGPPGGAPKGGLGGAPKGGFGSPPTSRMQLASLVTALDKVADQPLTVVLTPESRGIIADQIKGLESAEEIKDEDAKLRLETIHKILEKDRKTLEAVGYFFSVEGKGGFDGQPKDSPNPFKEGSLGARLKALQDRLGSKK